MTCLKKKTKTTQHQCHFPSRSLFIKRNKKHKSLTFLIYSSLKLFPSLDVLARTKSNYFPSFIHGMHEGSSVDDDDGDEGVFHSVEGWFGALPQFVLDR